MSTLKKTAIKPYKSQAYEDIRHIFIIPDGKKKKSKDKNKHNEIPTTRTEEQTQSQ